MSINLPFPLVLTIFALASCGSVKAPASDGGAGDAANDTDAGACVPSDPATEICGNGIDEDCNDQIDDPLLCDGAALLNVMVDPSGGAWASADVWVQVAAASGVAGTLECRSGKVGGDNTLGEAFEACGSNLFTPTLNPAATGDGLYRTEYRLVHDSGVTSDAVQLDYYLHQSLEGGLQCSLTVTPQALFTKALERLPVKVTDTDPTLVFRPDANVTDGGFAQLANPFIRLNFTPRDSAAFGFGSVSANSLGPTDGLLKPLSLRRHFQFNADRSLVLVTRRYAARRTIDFNVSCDVMRVRSSPDVGQGTTKVTDRCDAIVLNREGAGVCLQVAGTAISFPFSPPASVTSNLAQTLLGEIPLPRLIDNAMWRKLGAVHSPRPATLAQRVACGAANQDTCTQGGYSGRSGFRNFSPKCYGAPTCVENFDALWVAPASQFSALYLPDDELFRFE